jgi:hypothetical protein
MIIGEVFEEEGLYDLRALVEPFCNDNDDDDDG